MHLFYLLISERKPAWSNCVLSSYNIYYMFTCWFCKEEYRNNKPPQPHTQCRGGRGYTEEVYWVGFLVYWVAFLRCVRTSTSIRIDRIRTTHAKNCNPDWIRIHQSTYRVGFNPDSDGFGFRGGVATVKRVRKCISYQKLRWITRVRPLVRTAHANGW